VHLETKALCVLSDSGTISEESAILKFAAVTLRESIERPEALDAGSIAMTGLIPEDVVRAVEERVSSGASHSIPAEYEISDCSLRAVRFILSTWSRSADWWGIRS
jgi:UDP-N-acetylglucosamine 2-epimerase (non-hydrolysing)